VFPGTIGCDSAYVAEDTAACCEESEPSGSARDAGGRESWGDSLEKDCEKRLRLAPFRKAISGCETEANRMPVTLEIRAESEFKEDAAQKVVQAAWV
jgi:hypothetical protein